MSLDLLTRVSKAKKRTYAWGFFINKKDFNNSFFKWLSEQLDDLHGADSFTVIFIRALEDDIEGFYCEVTLEINL